MIQEAQPSSNHYQYSFIVPKGLSMNIINDFGMAMSHVTNSNSAVTDTKSSIIIGFSNIQYVNYICLVIIILVILPHLPFSVAAGRSLLQCHAEQRRGIGCLARGTGGDAANGDRRPGGDGWNGWGFGM